MTQIEDLEQEIDRYVEGLMGATERAAFEEKLANESELQNEVNLRRSIIKAIRREQIERIISNKEASLIRKGKIRKMVVYFGSLAAAACLTGFFYVGYLNNCENLANRYYVSYAYTPIPSRGGENLPLTKSDSIFFDALHQLENGDKKAAISQLESMNTSTAEMIAADNQAVKWYLSLAYLKNGQKKKARTLLIEIAKKANSEYQLKAKELLKEL
jgi:hypothetical protein